SSSSNPLLQSVPPSFSVVNEGIFAAYTAEFMCYYSQTRLLHAPSAEISDNWNGPFPLAKVLYRHQPINVKCENIHGPFVKVSDIELFSVFHPAYTWRRSYICTHFTLTQNAYRQPEWFRGPSQQCQALWLRLKEKSDEMEARKK